MRIHLSLPGLVLAALPALAFSAPPPQRLHQVPVGDSIRIAPPDAAAAKRASEMVLRRVDVYARDARVRVIENGVERAAARTTRALFATEPGAITRGYLSVGEDGDVRGMLADLSGERMLEGRWVDGALRVDSVRALEDTERSFQCGGNAEGPPAGPGQVSRNTRVAAAAKGVTGLQAVVAIDTDVELLANKFLNDTGDATDYLAELFLGMNVIYNNDLAITLMQGDVFLRVGTDPYDTVTSSGNLQQLNEFGEHWRVTYPALPRAFAAQLSGKSSASNSASGLAWLLNQGENYCSSTGASSTLGTFGHYSITRVFWNPGFPAAFDVSIVAHEIAHNFGAAHTHCTDADPVTPGTQHIDICFNGEADPLAPQCYDGATTACPSEFPAHGVKGTLMSYCHLRPGCGNEVVEEFHPVHQVLLGERIAQNVGFGCITTDAGGGDPDLVFGNGFE